MTITRRSMFFAPLAALAGKMTGAKPPCPASGMILLDHSGLHANELTLHSGGYILPQSKEQEFYKLMGWGRKAK